MDVFNPQNGFHTYYVYILTNKYRSTYYIGVTNNLKNRLFQHTQNVEQNNSTFASKYNLTFLVYYEKFTWIQEAIAREKELKNGEEIRKYNLSKILIQSFSF